MNYLIDPQGHWWRWPSAALAEKLGYTDPDFDLASYVARNLGYVWLVIDEQVTLLQFRAGMVSDAAVASLKPYLRKAVASRPVGLVYYASGWLEEAYVEPEPLLARLDELAPMREPRMRDQFIARAHRPSDWLYHAHQHLSGLFELWRFEDGVYSEPVKRYMESTGLIGRTVVLTGNDETDLRVIYGGAGFSVYDSFSFEKTVGRSIADQPDKAYGKWVAQSYILCRRSGIPQIEDIDAIIQQPGHDSRRRRYQRLILRWQQLDGNVLLTGSSMLNQNISIPLES
jgi:hypothetical protein